MTSMHKMSESSLWKSPTQIVNISMYIKTTLDHNIEGRELAVELRRTDIRETGIFVTSFSRWMT